MIIKTYELKKLDLDKNKYILLYGVNEGAKIEEIKRLSLKCFNLLNCSGWGRVDLIIDKENNPWVIELNTVPGMTEHSLVPMAANFRNINFNELVLKILNTSFK